MKKLNWRLYKIEQPHDYKSSTNVEDDPEYCFICYEFTHRPETMNKGPFVSGPYEFINGKFGAFSEHKDSKYLTDRSKILAWIPAREVTEFLLRSIIKQL